MDDSQIQTRLEEVFLSIMCPTAGCWPLYGGHSEYYFDEDIESHVLEVWPIAVQEPLEPEGNGHPESDILYELAEFDFMQIAEELPLEHFHFSQRQSLFEIGWREDGHLLELRVHIEPEEVGDE